MTRKLRAIVLAAVLLILAAISTATAAESDTQNRIDAVIAQYGGTQIAADTISWHDGEVTLHIRDSSEPNAIDSSPVGRYCAFQRAYYQGSIMSFSACPATYASFGPLGGTLGSIANKRSTGTVRAYTNARVKATLSPGQAAPLLTGITKITCT